MIFIIFSTTTLPVDDMAMRTANRRNGIKGPKLIESVLLHRYIWRCHEVGRALHIISHPEHETSVHACNVHVYCWNTICFIYTLLEYEYTTYARAISMRPSHKIQVINIQLRNRAKQNEEYALAESWWNGACSMQHARCRSSGVERRNSQCQPAALLFHWNGNVVDAVELSGGVTYENFNGARFVQA